MVVRPQIIPVILCGGVGSRLWPVSRAAHPKFFIRLQDNQSFLQKTLIRAQNLPHVSDIITVCNQELIFKIKSDYQEILKDPISTHYILEPFGRNTAPAMLAASLFAQKYFDDDATLLVLPADHLISDSNAFSSAVSHAAKLAQGDKLVTFGIVPTRPETGYGYIEHKETKVIQFVEKPTRDKAQAYLKNGNFLWNSGMFCFKANTLIHEMADHAADIYNTTLSTFNHSSKKDDNDQHEVSLKPDDFMAVPDDSIDYALMEKSNHVSVIKMDTHWQDIGCWQAFGEMTPADDNHNRINGHAILKDSQHCTINSDKRMIAGVGLTDLMIIDTPDALLVADKSRTQEVKDIYKALKETNHETHKFHQTVYRPWGTYTVLEEGPCFKIKRIVVNPHESLSLQLHHHRSEHWVVVNGEAWVQNGEATMTLKQNESTFIPAQNKHRLKNTTDNPLTIIEVQTGSYLGEDDIVRFEDQYGREAQTV